MEKFFFQSATMCIFLDNSQYLRELHKSSIKSYSNRLKIYLSTHKKIEGEVESEGVAILKQVLQRLIGLEAVQCAGYGNLAC